MSRPGRSPYTGRMRALIAALVLSATGLGAAQTRVWLKTTSRPGSDTYTDVVTDPLGNVFVCGNTIDSVSTKISMLAVKYDKNGVKLWEKVLPGASGHSFSTAIALDPNGHVVVVGQTPEVADVLWAFLDHQSTVRDLVKLNAGGEPESAPTQPDHHFVRMLGRAKLLEHKRRTHRRHDETYEEKNDPHRDQTITLKGGSHGA